MNWTDILIEDLINWTPKTHVCCEFIAEWIIKLSSVCDCVEFYQKSTLSRITHLFQWSFMTEKCAPLRWHARFDLIRQGNKYERGTTNCYSKTFQLFESKKKIPNKLRTFHGFDRNIMANDSFIMKHGMMWLPIETQMKLVILSFMYWLLNEDNEYINNNEQHCWFLPRYSRNE